MKKGIAILLTFLYSLFSYGQGISVSRFQLFETDLTANTNGTKYTYKVVAKATTGDSTLSRSVTVYRVARQAISSVGE